MKRRGSRSVTSGACGSGALVLLMLVVAVPPAAAAKQREAKPDLVVIAASKPPAQVARGGLLAINATVSNRGKGASPPALTGLYLSRDRKPSRDDLRLDGRVESRALRKARRVVVPLRTAVPDAAPLGSFYVVACADDSKGVGEADERNNCKASKQPLKVADRDGSPPAPTTRQLVESAVASGRITPETALVFRVYDQFGDARLPTAFRGAPGASDEFAMSEAASKFPTMPPRARKLLKPFLQRPYAAGSWWQQRYGRSGGGVRAAAASKCDGPGWSYVDAKVPVRIWYQDRYRAQGDERLARQLAAEFDKKIYTDLTALMGRAPQPDDPGLVSRAIRRLLGWCDGGNTSLDIHLTDMRDAGHAKAWGQCDGSPVDIDLNRSAGAKLEAGAIHEFMHAIQYAYNAVDSCGKLEWWMDATADWAIDYVDADNNGEHPAHVHFLDTPDLPLDANPATRPSRRYGASVFAFFLARTQGPGAIANSWAEIEKQTAVRAVDTAAGRFATAWPNYARFAINEPLRPAEPGFDALRKDDQPLAATTTAIDGVTLNDERIPLTLGDRPERELRPRSLAVARLATRYFKFDASDPAIRSIAIDAPAPESTDVKLQVLGRLGDAWEKVEVPPTGRVLCPRTAPADAYDQLLLVYSNASLEDDWAAGDEELPRVISSNIGCRYTGGAGAESSVFEDYGFVAVTSTETLDGSGLVFARDPETSPTEDGEVRFVATAGQVDGQFDGQCDVRISGLPSTTLSATASGSIPADAYAELWINMLGENPGERRVYRGDGAYSHTFPANGDCALDPDPAPRHDFGAFFAPQSDAPLRVNDATGAITGTFTNPLISSPSYLRHRWALSP